MVTACVLDLLKHYAAKATFFCIGSNVEAQPGLFARIRQEGHTVGNHTYNHLNGWKVSDAQYTGNIADCQRLTQSNLFRPPYGRIRRSQIKALIPDYRIVMWDVLSGDFDLKLTGADCLKNITKTAKNGSIVVMHDSAKGWERLKDFLEPLLAWTASNGYRCEAL